MIIFLILNLFSVIFMFWNSAFKRGNLELQRYINVFIIIITIKSHTLRTHLFKDVNVVDCKSYILCLLLLGGREREGWSEQCPTCNIYLLSP